MQRHLSLTRLQESRRLLPATSPNVSRSRCRRQKLACVSQSRFTARPMRLCVRWGRMRGGFLRRQRGPLSRAESMERVQSDTSYRSARRFLAAVELVTFIRGIFHSADCASSHAAPSCSVPARPMAAPRRLVRNPNWLHGVASSLLFNFSLPAVQQDPIWTTLVLLHEKNQKADGDGLLLLDECLLLKRKLCCWTACPTQSYLVFETSAGVAVALSGTHLSGTQCSIAPLR